jgi:hypothetical protein
MIMKRCKHGIYLMTCSQCAYEDEKSEPLPVRPESSGWVVVCAANKLKSGLIVTGARHHDKIMNAQIAASGQSHVGETQGFINQFGNFMTRSEALEVALKTGQRKHRCGGDSKQLFSENLY